MASYKISDEISVPNAEGLQINYVHFGATSKTLILEVRPSQTSTTLRPDVIADPFRSPRSIAYSDAQSDESVQAV